MFELVILYDGRDKGAGQNHKHVHLLFDPFIVLFVWNKETRTVYNVIPYNRITFIYFGKVIVCCNNLCRILFVIYSI